MDTTTGSGVPTVTLDQPRPATPTVDPVDGDAATSEATDADSALVERFVAFSLDPDAASTSELGLASEGAQLGLGDRLLTELPVASAPDPAAWEIPEDVFRGRVGPFSAIDVMAREVAGSDGDPSVADESGLIVTFGDHPHCVSPPVPAPPEMNEMRRVSVQPSPNRMQSCLDWFTIDFFVDSDGLVAAITLDLWEP
ncbi:hypothetical protein [Georgenia satyanarayanai]|uniref:hypothetical protein n=1 Tax=Georgenia satyanarayanai TaxID=860221 RepID=UPI0011B43BAA|nr:hypothetical protein [Georgenia satyanarayanai]